MQCDRNNNYSNIIIEFWLNTFTLFNVSSLMLELLPEHIGLLKVNLDVLNTTSLLMPCLAVILSVHIV